MPCFIRMQKFFSAASCDISKQNLGFAGSGQAKAVVSLMAPSRSSGQQDRPSSGLIGKIRQQRELLGELAKAGLWFVILRRAGHAGSAMVAILAFTARAESQGRARARLSQNKFCLQFNCERFGDLLLKFEIVGDACDSMFPLGTSVLGNFVGGQNCSLSG